MQVTAPYAHAQARKAERYIRTIEDGIQALLADAKLPPSFWGDAALTTQYLRNRLPTSTLTSDTTPYEIMHGSKPDLSHLRVWGCQCFPSIPPELRTKGGPRRYEAIFVGYEDKELAGAFVIWLADTIFLATLSSMKLSLGTYPLTVVYL